MGRQTMKFEAAIFDLDGTLLNSMDVWKQIDISFLQKMELPVPADYVTEICLRSFAEAAQYTIDLFKLSEKVEDMVKEYPDIFEFAAQKLVVRPEQCLVFDDVLPAVRSAKQTGILVCGVYDKYSVHHRTEMEQIADGYLIDFKDAPLPDCEG